MIVFYYNNGDNKMKKGRSIITTIIFLTIIFLTVGYAAFSDHLTITNSIGHVIANINLRITGVTSISPYASNTTFTTKTINSDISLPAGESITYSTDIRNLGNVPAALADVTFEGPNGVIASLSSNINNNNYVRICNTNNVCVTNVNKTIDITITNTTSSPLNINNLKINLTFTPFYTVTYDNTLIGYALENNTFTYTFPNNAPTSVIVNSGTCGTPTITNNILTIPNITSNLVLSESNTPTGTWTDPYINNNTTYNYTNLPVGTTQFVNTNVAGNPKVTISNINGVNKVTKYEFTSNANITSNNTISTGLMPFDGDPFTIHTVFTAQLSNNNGKQLFSALTENSSGHYSGFIIIGYGSKSLNIYELNNSTISSSGSGGTQIASYSINKLARQSTEFTLDITFNPSTSTMHISITPGNNQGNNVTQDRTTNIIQNLSNGAVITIGGNGIESSHDVNSITVSEFSITRGS